MSPGGRQAQPQSSGLTEWESDRGAASGEVRKASSSTLRRSLSTSCPGSQFLGGWHCVGKRGEEFCPVPILSHEGCLVTKFMSQG